MNAAYYVLTSCKLFRDGNTSKQCVFSAQVMWMCCVLTAVGIQCSLLLKLEISEALMH